MKMTVNQKYMAYINADGSKRIGYEVDEATFKERSSHTLSVCSVMLWQSVHNEAINDAGTR